MRIDWHQIGYVRCLSKLRSVEKFLEGHAKRGTKFLDIYDRDIALAIFNAAQIRLVEAALESETLLSESLNLTQLAYTISNPLLY